jgi:hypothetical protein
MPVAITPPLKQQQMEQVIMMRNYGLDIEAAILEAMLKCQNRATDFVFNEQEKKKYTQQLIELKQLHAYAKHITKLINNI